MSTIYNYYNNYYGGIRQLTINNLYKIKEKFFFETDEKSVGPQNHFYSWFLVDCSVLYDLQLIFPLHFFLKVINGAYRDKLLWNEVDAINWCTTRNWRQQQKLLRFFFTLDVSFFLLQFPFHNLEWKNEKKQKDRYSEL